MKPLTPEEFYSEYYNKEWQPKDKFDKQSKKFDYFDMTDFAQAYTKHLIENAVSDFKKEIKYFKGNKTLKRNIYWLEEKDLQQLLNKLK